MDTQKAVVLAAAGVAGAALLYCYLKEDAEAKLVKPAGTSTGSRKGKVQKLEVNQVGKEQVHGILMEIVESQNKMREHMKVLNQELLAKSLSFDDIYKRIRDVQPEDPLERYGLSMLDFDTLLSKYQTDPEVRDGIAKIMGVPDAIRGNDRASSATAPQVVEVHNFMLAELGKVVEQFVALKQKGSYDTKIVTLVAQAIVGAKVEQKYSLTTEDIERAVVNNHDKLAKDQEFAKINEKMQAKMAELMGADMKM